MRDELRALRKESMKPVSRLKKADCQAELERLRGVRESVPPVAAVNGAKPKKMMPKESDVKMMKTKEFPMAPVEEKKKGGKKSSGMAVGKSAVADVPAKKSKMDKLREMLEAMGSDDE